MSSPTNLARGWLHSQASAASLTTVRLTPRLSGLAWHAGVALIALSACTRMQVVEGMN